MRGLRTAAGVLPIMTVSVLLKSGELVERSTSMLTIVVAIIGAIALAGLVAAAVLPAGLT